MERFAIKKMLAWKQSSRRKPLILKGVRQVGKTWILKEFGKRYYKNVAYFKEALQKPLFPSRIEQNRSVRFFFTTSKNGVFFAIKIVKFYCADVCDLVTLLKSCLMVN